MINYMIVCKKNSNDRLNSHLIKIMNYRIVKNKVKEKDLSVG